MSQPGYSRSDAPVLHCPVFALHEKLMQARGTHLSLQKPMGRSCPDFVFEDSSSLKVFNR